LSLERAANATVAALPQARDARQAVSGLRVPHTHVARQAAAHQQHAVAGQALDVHEVPAQHQRRDLGLGRRVAVVVTGQLPAPPPAGPLSALLSVGPRRCVC